MSYYTITCPYCFRTMGDDEVHFRSERVSDETQNPIPEEYEDLGSFVSLYKGDDKKRILEEAKEYQFFTPREDAAYEEFWRHFKGTTEYNQSDEVMGVKAYLRPVIDPKNKYHQTYLKAMSTNSQGEKEYFIRDHDNMVTQIELTSGERCTRRVCKHCHNPLPDNYGKTNVKFTSVIGITGSGKTVFLSQLLHNMKSYAAYVGISAVVKSGSTVAFLDDNHIEANKPLPGSTPAGRLQQPLFYQMERDVPGGGKETSTFVLYDVAGEVFTDPERTKTFAPFIQHSDGIILLIDPMQFDAVSGVAAGGQRLDESTKALDTIHDIVTNHRMNEKCDVPCAVCISKVDTPEVQEVLSDELKSMLQQNVTGVHRPNSRLYAPVFNAHEYNKIARELDGWFSEKDITIYQQLHNSYTTYSFFAFTALGCDVKDGVPVGPIKPMRLQEPILWLFHCLDYIDVNEKLFQPGTDEIPCPNCGSKETERNDGYIEIQSKTGLLGFLSKEKVPVNYQCNSCGHRWMQQGIDQF